MDNLKLKISASPHVRSKDTTSDIMFDVIVALVPAAAFGIWQFGWYAGLLVAVCIASAVLFEFIYQKGMHKKVTIGDCSAALTGLLLALNLPPEFPIWMAILGSAFAIIIVKQLFGGLGQNFMNPALGARCFLLLAFSRYMTAFVYDGVSTATPLAVLKNSGEVNLSNMFFGYTAGTIGETSVLALLIGAAYLLIKRIISPKIPLVYIGTFAAAIAIYAAVCDYNVPVYTLAHLCGGGLMLGAWFMATDYVTSPITSKGKIVYGVILGLLTFVLRTFGSSAEGVSYAIIISNLLVPLIEKATMPKSFGQGADIKDKKAKNSKSNNSEASAGEEQSGTEGKNAVSGADEKATDDKAAKDKFDVKGIVKAIAAIFAITVIMGAALGVVYNITKKPIEDANAKAKEEAYKEVFPDAGCVISIDEGTDYEQFNQVLASYGFTNTHVDEISVAGSSEEGSADNELLGYIILVTSTQGYGGDIQLAVGISNEGVIQGISFLQLSETAGLGMEADSEEFRSQYVGKNVSKFTVTKTGSTKDSEIDAISGATITSNAVTDAVNMAIRTFYLLTGGN